MTERVGTCSLCGGDVMGHRGGWWSITPPPPDECSQCGAVRAESVIQMVPRPPHFPTHSGTATIPKWISSDTGGSWRIEPSGNTVPR